MNVFFVYAHEDPTSFGAALHNRALSYFEKHATTTTVSDLYASGFHAVAEKWDFKVSGGAHKNYMFEQQRVSKDGGSMFAEDIQQEISRLRIADLVIVEFPLWWSAPPAMMKGWFDKIFALGVAWDGDHRYSKGLLKGKQVLVVTTAGDTDVQYSASGIHGATVEQHLYPLLHSTLAHSGMDVLKPFVCSGLTLSSQEERQDMLDNLEKYLMTLDENPAYLYKHS